MNFLAHLQVADPTPESRLGNLLGDFVRGLPDDDRFSPAIWRGIKMHRHVDAFTDSNPLWKRSRNRLSRERRRFAGIIVDVFYDHFLVKHWKKFESLQPIESFVDDCHADLRLVMDQAPDEAREALKRMESQEWLLGSRTIEGIDLALHRISRRSDILIPVRESVIELEENFDGLEVDFLEFYPELLAYVEKEWREV